VKTVAMRSTTTSCVMWTTPATVPFLGYVALSLTLAGAALVSADLCDVFSLPHLHRRTGTPEARLE
jgi:hypothetical protein